MTNKSKQDSCINALGSLNTHGYGRISLGNIEYGAHVVAYRLFKGSIPHEKNVDHICRNRACINPDHLRLLTVKENTLSGIGATAIHARKTHCFRGHLFNEENTYHPKKNRRYRQCRTCLRVSFKKYDQKRKAK